MNWWRRWRIAIVVAALGLAMVTMGLVADWQQWPSLLAQTGIVLALFGVLYQAERWLEGSIRQVADNAAVFEQRLDTLDENLEETRQELVVALKDADKVMRERRNVERQRVSQLFDDFATAPSVDALRALYESLGAGAVSGGGLRVRVPGTDSWLRVKRPEYINEVSGVGGEQRVARFTRSRLWVESAEGTKTSDALEWKTGQDVATLGLAVADALVQAADYPGDDAFDIGRIVARLRDDLRWISDQRSHPAGRGIGPVIELPTEQWAITERGMESRAQPLLVDWHLLLDTEPGPGLLLGTHWIADPSWVEIDQLRETHELALKLQATESVRQLAQEDVPF